MSARTLFLARLIGLYYLIASLTMFPHKLSYVEIVSTLVNMPALVFIAAIMTLATGLAMVLGHNIWYGGALPIVVTVIGWLTLIKGVILLTPGAAMSLWSGLQYERFFYLYAAISFVLGAYMTYAGFKPAQRRETTRGRLAA